MLPRDRRHALTLVYAQSLLVLVVLNAGRVVLSLNVLEAGGSASDVGGVLAMLYVFSLLLSWPAGVLADRHGSRWLLVAGSAAGALGMLVPAFWSTLPAFWCGAAGIGLAIAFTNVLGQNLVGVLSAPERRTQSFSNYSLIGALGNFVGPLLAGFTIDHAGFAASSLVVALLAALATLLLLAWGRLLPPGQRPAGEGGGSLLASLAEPAMRRILAISSLAQVGFDAFTSFMPVYAHGAGLSASAIGVALSAFAVAAFAARIVMARLIAAWNEGWVLAAGFVAGALAFFLLPLSGHAVALSAISFVFGLFVGVSQPITMMMVFSASAAGRSGEALGLRQTVNNLMRVIAPAVFGATARAFGFGPLFAASGLLMCAGVVLSRALARR